MKVKMRTWWWWYWLMRMVRMMLPLMLTDSMLQTNTSGLVRLQAHSPLHSCWQPSCWIFHIHMSNWNIDNISDFLWKLHLKVVFSGTSWLIWVVRAVIVEVTHLVLFVMVDILKAGQTLNVETHFPLSQVNSSSEQGIGLVGVGVEGFSASQQWGLQCFWCLFTICGICRLHRTIFNRNLAVGGGVETPC